MIKKNRQKPASYFVGKWYIDVSFNVRPFGERTDLGFNHDGMYNRLNCFDSFDDAFYASVRIKVILKDLRLSSRRINDDNIIYFIREDMLIESMSSDRATGELRLSREMIYNFDRMKFVGNYFATKTIALLVLDTIQKVLSTCKTSKHPYRLLNHIRFWFSSLRFKLPR